MKIDALKTETKLTPDVNLEQKVQTISQEEMNELGIKQSQNVPPEVLEETEEAMLLNRFDVRTKEGRKQADAFVKQHQSRGDKMEALVERQAAQIEELTKMVGKFVETQTPSEPEPEPIRAPDFFNPDNFGDPESEEMQYLKATLVDPAVNAALQNEREVRSQAEQVRITENRISKHGATPKQTEEFFKWLGNGKNSEEQIDALYQMFSSQKGYSTPQLNSTSVTREHAPTASRQRRGVVFPKKPIGHIPQAPPAKTELDALRARYIDGVKQLAGSDKMSILGSKR